MVFNRKGSGFAVIMGRKFECASEPFLFLFMFALGGNLSLLPQLTIAKICHDKFNSSVCSKLGQKAFKDEENYIYSQAATWNTIIFVSVYLPSLFTILPVGAISDTISKKKLLLLPPIATVLQCIIYICCARYKELSVGYLALGSSITCIYGDIQGGIMLAYCYMTGVTGNDHGRTWRMAILEGSIFIGQGLGSYMAGILLEKFGFTVAFLFPATTAFLNFAFVLFLLPNLPSAGNHSLTHSHTEIDGQGDESFCLQLGSNLKDIFKKIAKFGKKYFCSSGKLVVLLLLAAFFANGAILGENVLITFFLKHSPLSLDAQEIGQYFLILHCTRGIGISFLALLSAKFFRPSDYIVTILGLVSLIATHISLCFANTKPMLYGFSVLSFAFPYAMSTIRALLTKLVSPGDEGTVLSYVGFISLIAVTIMTFAGNSLFKATAKIFPGLSILMLSCSSIMALVLVTSVWCIASHGGKGYEKNEGTELNDEQCKTEEDPLIEKCSQ